MAQLEQRIAGAVHEIQCTLSRTSDTLKLSTISGSAAPEPTSGVLTNSTLSVLKPVITPVGLVSSPPAVASPDPGIDFAALASQMQHLQSEMQRVDGENIALRNMVSQHSSVVVPLASEIATAPLPTENASVDNCVEKRTAEKVARKESRHSPSGRKYGEMGT